MTLQVPAFILILMLIVNTAIAQEQLLEAADGVKGVHEKIAQKIKMVNYILNGSDLLQRVQASGDRVASELLARASQNFLRGEEYFERGEYLEAEAVLDYVLRDLGASSQLLNLPQKKRNQYQKFIEKLDSFVLPEWENLGERENELLQIRLERVSELRDQAIRQADAGTYDDAIASLEEAYGLKVSLIDSLKHETTVVYDLNFSTIQDEYQYMINRTYHFLELVQMALSEPGIGVQTRQLTDPYIYRSMLNLEIAEDLEAQGQFSEAIPVLDESINQLSAVLKILGIEI